VIDWLLNHLIVGVAFFVFAALGFIGAPLIVWTIATAIALFALGAPLWLWTLFGITAAVFNIAPIRRVVSLGVMHVLRALRFLPEISETEKQAIAAGDVWIERELFSGRPDFERILAEPYAALSAEEQAFLDGPVQRVCDLTDDWQVRQQRDLPLDVWQYLKRERFFGMIIPKEYHGLGLSPSANSAVVAKLSSASVTLAVTVMVPNSLGPAELLIHYGTEKQKNHYLPRLARGQEIPAFALTEPGAGSDAGSITASGEVIGGEDGRLRIRLHWKKRYITLAAISTVLGVAFRLRDPENLLGRGTDLGITLALIPTDTKGVVLGRRHDPLGVPFYNSPTEGHDVVVPLEDAVIGGLGGVGRGWTMLMESLAAGRGVSLPALATAGVKKAARVTGAHAFVRQQFGLSIGKFEGIHEALARIGGWAYTLEAMRRFLNGALDGGSKPGVVNAMAKYHFTELQRKAVNDAMDILGGNGISLGPRNLIGGDYIGTPIAITVEGANILTRTLMIFGQGAIRSHPYALREIEAIERWDVKEFDTAFWGHIGHVVRNASRALLLSLSHGRLAASPVAGPTARFYRRLAWSSASFAFLADVAMGTMGGDLKRNERITGRFADIFSWMVLGTAVLRRWEAEGRLKEDLPFVEWSMEYALGELQRGFDGLFENLTLPGITWIVRGPVAIWSRLNSIGNGPPDSIGSLVATALQRPGEQRDRLTSGLYISLGQTRGIARLDRAFDLVYAADGIVRKIRDAIRGGRLPKASPLMLLNEATNKGIVSSGDAALVRMAAEAREDAIQVDSFTLDEYMQRAPATDIGVPAIDSEIPAA
jgi:acyl-CoA dehydrogenase